MCYSSQQELTFQPQMWYNSTIVAMVNDGNQTRPIATVLNTMKAGFELTTRHWWLVLLPLLLDCFLWVGPRLSVSEIGRTAITWWLEQADAIDNESFAIPENSEEILLEALDRTNLMTQLSLPMLGVPVLMGGLTPTDAPLEPAVIELNSAERIIGNYALLSLLGLFVSALYFSLVARVVRGEAESGWEFGRKLLPRTLRLIAMALLLLIILLIIAFPVMIIAGVAGLFNIGLAFLVMIGGSVILMWVLIYLSFSLHALMLNDVSIIQALLTSMRLIQNHFPYALPLLLGVLIVNNITNSLWLAADGGTWLTIINLFGHAFIATAMVASMFIFFQERTAPKA